MGPTCHPETLANTYYKFKQHNKQKLLPDKIFCITTYLRRNQDNVHVDGRKLLKLELTETDCNSMD
jgi:non-ribosomal peptide synthetase component E (peptide arylation enzyme)